MRLPVLSALFLSGMVALVPARANGAAPNDLTCTFKMGSNVTYAKGKYSSANVMPLTFKVTDIDLAKQNASLDTGSGSTPLRVVRAVNANHYLEVITEGFLNITTIYDRDSETGTYPAVHSRHFGLFGQPVIAQYYGFCTDKTR